MQVGNKDPIHWCTSKSSKNKTNPMQLKKKLIDPDGNVVWISLANGKAQTAMMGNMYAQWITAAKTGKNFIDYYECEQGCNAIPKRDGSRERKELVRGLCEECAAREVLIETRVKAKNLSNREYEKLFETRLDKLTSVLEAKMVGEQRPTVSPEDLAEVMTAEPPKRKRGRPRKVKTDEGAGAQG